MKRIFTLAICLLGCLPFLQAQVTMTRSSHGFNAGDAHLTQEVKYKDVGVAGQGQTWDFSNLETIGAPDTSYLETNETYGIGLKVVRNSDNAITYYNITSDANEFKGYTLGAFNVIFDRPIVKAQYPQTYGSSFEGTFDGTVYVSNNEYGKVKGNYSTQVDASGTILLPNNVSLPAVRVKTMERMPNSVCNCDNGNIIETIKYLWYAQETRYPLFVSITSTVYGTDNSVKSTAQHTYLNTQVERKAKSVSQPVAEQNIAYNVSPNPFKDNIQVSYELPQKMKVSISLYDAMGVKLASVVSPQTQEGKQSVSFFAAPYAKKEGVYFLQIQFGEKIYSEKIMKVAF